MYRSRSSLLLRLIPDRTIHFLVERRTSRRELAQLVVLGAHEGRAITERPADALAVQLAMLLKLAHEIRLRESRTTHASERGPAVAHIGGGGVDQIFLQVAVTTADDRQLRKRLLKLGGQAKVASHAD